MFVVLCLLRTIELMSNPKPRPLKREAVLYFALINPETYQGYVKIMYFFEKYAGLRQLRRAFAVPQVAFVAMDLKPYREGFHDK